MSWPLSLLNKTTIYDARDYSGLSWKITISGRTDVLSYNKILLQIGTPSIVVYGPLVFRIGFLTGEAGPSGTLTYSSSLT